VHLDVGEIAPLRGIAHRAGDMREAAAEQADEVPGTVAETKDKEPHTSSLQVGVPVRAAARPPLIRDFWVRQKILRFVSPACAGNGCSSGGTHRSCRQKRPP